MADQPIYSCTIPKLTPVQAELARTRAAEESPVRGALAALHDGLAGLGVSADRIAILTSKWFGPKRTTLTYAFMEPTTAELRNMFDKYLNRWSDRGTVRIKFVYSTTDAEVRISRGPEGHFSYLGTDVFGIPKSQQTMNIDGFTVKTPQSEWLRVVPHEAGHTLGAVHEHQRKEILDLLDWPAVTRYFRQTQGWDAKTTREQILSGEAEADLTGSPHTELNSIMAYSFEAFLTKSGKPIPGGSDITDMDFEFMAKIYPTAVAPPPPVEPPPGKFMTWIDGKRYPVGEAA